MPDKLGYNIFLTFDCDPANFDPSLKVLGDPGFLHLRESVPAAIELLLQASKILEKEIKATFFIRNISTDFKGMITPEPWNENSDLWEELVARGHSLGLHPHIDVPIQGESDPKFSLLIELMNQDFESLKLMNEFGRVTRVGGHAYNSLTAAMLRESGVSIDSSAIPGRKLGKYDGCSNWVETNNSLIKNWDYPNFDRYQHDPVDRLAQLPMTTIRKITQSDYRRYIDFSFASFEEFSFSEFRPGAREINLVAISHPSTLLENQYSEHSSLKFGTDNWLSNLFYLMKRLNIEENKIEFCQLSDVT